jgi:ParB family chromosome partitioning protein
VTQTNAYAETNVDPNQIDLPTQVRLADSDAFSEELLRQLGESLRERQLACVGVRKHPDKPERYVAVWGFRRIRAALLVKLPSLQARVVEDGLTESQITIIQLTENLLRADLTGYEKWRAAAGILEQEPGLSQKDLATRLRLDPGMVTRLLSPGKCVLAVREALKSGRVTLADCYAISRAGSDGQQDELLAAKLDGASAAEVTHRVRKAKRGTPAVKVCRLRCPLPSGAVVQVSLAGEGGIDEALEAVQDWMKEARKASEQGLDARTFERVCRDKAAK